MIPQSTTKIFYECVAWRGVAIVTYVREIRSINLNFLARILSNFKWLSVVLLEEGRENVRISVRIPFEVVYAFSSFSKLKKKKANLVIYVRTYTTK